MKFLEQNDIKLIEEELGVKLPQHYINFNLKKTRLIKKLRKTDVNPEDDSMWLATDTDHIIEFNKMYGLPKNEGPTRGKLYIGGDGCGGSAFININELNDERIYFVSPDDYTEIFNEEIDDFNWDNELTLGGKDLKEYIKEKIDINKGY